MLLDDLELTYPQYLVLLVLWEHGTVPVRDIGAALHLDYGPLTPLIKRLEAIGLVHRKRSAEDERTVQVSLTEQGDELRERAAAVPPVIINATGLTAKQIDDTMRTLRQLAENVAADRA